MYLTQKQNEYPQQSLINTFGGLNKGISIAENEFATMTNMCGNSYPVLSSREKRSVLKEFMLKKMNDTSGVISKLEHKTEHYVINRKSICESAPNNPMLGDRWAKISVQNVDGVERETVDGVYQYSVQKHFELMPVARDSWENVDKLSVDIQRDGKYIKLAKDGSEYLSLFGNDGETGFSGSKEGYTYIIIDGDNAEARKKAEEDLYHFICVIYRYQYQEYIGVDVFKRVDFTNSDGKLERYYVEMPSWEARTRHHYGVKYTKADGSSEIMMIEDAANSNIFKTGSTPPTKADSIEYAYYLQANYTDPDDLNYGEGPVYEFYARQASTYNAWGLISSDAARDYDIIRKSTTYYESGHIPLAFTSNGQWAFSTIRYDGAKRLYVSSAESEHGYTIGSLADDVSSEIAEADDAFLYSQKNIDNLIAAEAKQKRQIITMGAKVVIFPEGYYVNTADTSDRGYLENKRYPLWKDGYCTANNIKISPCSMDGTTLTADAMGVNPPSDPENGDIWLDISKSTSDYKMWDASTKSWNSIATTYLKIECKGAFKGFKQWDSIYINGFDTGSVIKINKNKLDPIAEFNKSGMLENTNSVAESDPELYISSFEDYMESRISRFGQLLEEEGFEAFIKGLETMLQTKFTAKKKEALRKEYIEKGMGDAVLYNENLPQQIQDLNDKTYILYQCTNNYIVIAGLLDAVVTLASQTYTSSKANVSKTWGSYSFERRVPKMDYYCQCGNRIWGCRFGLDEDGNEVNEIKACKLGDPTNWNSFMGLSTDSYSLNVGVDGTFTGAVSYNGYPLFFKNKYILKIYGSTPSSYQLNISTLRGAGANCHSSFAICDNRLYYATDNEFVVYDGAGVYCISDALGKLDFDSCIAGTDGKKVYFATTKSGSKKLIKTNAEEDSIIWQRKDDEEERHLYVYTPSMGFWHEEDCPDIMFFAPDGHVLYYLERYYDKNYDCTRYRIKSVNENFNHYHIQGTWQYDDYPHSDDDVEWAFETGDIGFADPYSKYIQKIAIRAAVEAGGNLSVFIAYNGEEFEHIRAAEERKGSKAVDYIFPVRRCDYFRLKVEGKGQVDIISIYKSYLQGSDKP